MTLTPVRSTPPSSRCACGLPAVLFVAVALGGAFLLGACGAKDSTHEITDVRERPDAGKPAPPSTLEERLGLRRGPAESPHGASRTPAGDLGWTWATPEGWTELPPAPMRIAGWRVAGNADTEATFSTAGGDVAPNVTRWRKQLDLEPLDTAAVEALPRDKTMFGRPAIRVEFTGHYRGMRGDKDIPDAKMLGLIAVLPQTSAFLKMTGPAAVVDAEAEKFYALGASLKMASPADAHATAATSPETPEPTPGEAPRAAFEWTVPEGWTPAPARPPRLATFIPASAAAAPEGTPKAECYVTVLAGKAGGARPNITLWRQQVGLTVDFTLEEFQALPRKSILGGTAIFVTLEGTRDGAPVMLLGMILERAQDSVFVKMVGPADQVRPEQERFRAFCESFREPAGK